MKIDYSPYALTPYFSLNSLSAGSQRQGALLRIYFADECMGYADCHPWEELGDKSLQQQLDLLRKGVLTSLTARSLYFAEQDAKARDCKQPLLDCSDAPSSHFLITDLGQWSPEDSRKLVEWGYTHVKIKMGRSLEQEMILLDRFLSMYAFKVRLDFNEKLNKQQFEDVLSKISHLLVWIDFIEDPFPYHEKEWTIIQKTYGIKLACDRQVEKAVGKQEACQFLVCKPAIQTLDTCRHRSQTTIVTSYLDHPLGQLTAAYTAAQLESGSTKKGVHGLQSHHAYHPTAFSSSLSWNSPIFKIPAGSGFGFDELLEKQTWLRL